MRLKCLAALAIAAISLALAIPQSASAGGFDARHSAHSRYIPAPYPGGPDPYAYRFERRGYYPYLNSGQWVPLRLMKGRTHYRRAYSDYGAAWGYPVSCRTQWRQRNCADLYKRHKRRARHW